MKDRRLLVRALVESVEGRPPCNFYGTKSELRALTDAVAATKIFECVLMNDDSTLDQITEALRRKHACARTFEHVFSFRWPL